MCDCDSPAIYEAKIVRANKAYKCCECDNTIERREEYERVNGLWDGSWGGFRTCSNCVATRQQIRSRIDVDYCYGHGELAEIISDYGLICHSLEEAEPDDRCNESVSLGDHCVLACEVPWLKRGKGGRYEIVAEMIEEVAA